MSIVLIRHGETALNAARILQPADTPLSERGEAQATALASRMREAGLAGIVSSDQPRARRTAEIIAASCGLEVAFDELLRERNFGDLRGRPIDSLGYDPLALVEAPPGGEALAAFTVRVGHAFERVVARRATLDGPLAVVTHGLVIAMLLNERVGSAMLDGRPLRVGNTSVTMLQTTAPHAVELLACVRHLDRAVGADGAVAAGG